MTNGTETQSKRVGEAGHWGKDIRSDAHIWIEPRERGGIDIVLEFTMKARCPLLLLAALKRQSNGWGSAKGSEFCQTN
jgi:hypothetical protein